MAKKEARTPATHAKKAAINVGDNVAFNMLRDTPWFTVLAIDGFTLTIQETGTNYAPEKIDVCYVKQHKPRAIWKVPGRFKKAE